MPIKIFDLNEAAEFLKMHPESLRRKAAAGKIPGGKPGRSWCFREDDLAEYLRSLYAVPAKASWGVNSNKEELWHSTGDTIYGGSQLAIVESEYNKQLGLKTK